VKFLKIPKGTEYWAGIFFIFGLIGLIAATGFWLFNLLFSAFGLMQLTGGVINWDFSNIYIPAFSIVSGGKIGLIMGILGGLLSTISEGRLWVVPTKDKGNKSVIEKKNLFISFSVIFVIYDILSSYYFLNSGWYTDGFISSALIMAATIIFFSVGPEMFMVWAFETMAENHEEGIPAVGAGIGIVLSAIKKIAGYGWNAVFGEKEEEDETQNIKDSIPQRRGRGRPRNDYVAEQTEDFGS